MEDKRICVLDPDKICDDCGECDRCDLDPNKICDNCCRCIAMEDEGNEMRSRIINADYVYGKQPNAMGNRLAKRKENEPGGAAPLYKKTAPKAPEMAEWDAENEPTELTPELVEYWEKVLIEHGEAPADDGFGEIEVSSRIPVRGKRAVKPHKRKNE